MGGWPQFIKMDAVVMAKEENPFNPSSRSAEAQTE